MDRITQLQDEIQRVRNDPTRIDTRIDVTHNPQQLLMIMSSSIAYLTSRSTFLQVSPDIPVTKTRNPDKFDPPEVFEGETPPPRPDPRSSAWWSLTRSGLPLASKHARARRRPDRQSKADPSPHSIAPRARTRGNTGESLLLLLLLPVSPLPPRFPRSVTSRSNPRIVSHTGTPPRSARNSHDGSQRGLRSSSRSRESVRRFCSSPASLNIPPPSGIAGRLHRQYSELLRSLLDNADVEVDVASKTS